LLVAAGATTTSYHLTATDPSWRATSTSTVQPLDFARSSPGVGQLPNGYVLLFGGSENGYAISSVTQYDPNTVTVPDGVSNQTRTLRSMNVPRAEFGYATDANDLSYAIGGMDNNGTPLSSVEVYTPSTNTWSYLAPLPQALYGESAASDGAGHIFVFGGISANGAISTTVFRYTIASNTWDQLSAPLQVGVWDSAAVSAPNGLIYVLGGQTASGATSTVESYNPTTNTWNLETALPQPISAPAAAVDSLGRIAVLGGYDANGNALATTFVSQELSNPDAAPTITSTAPTSGVLNANYSYQVTSTGNPQAWYTLTSAPSDMSINQSTGLISWTPTAIGSYSVTVQANNGVGTTSQTFSVNVLLPQPAAPTGVTASYLSTTAANISWTASTDPYVTSYSVYLQHVTVYHSPRGSGGGRIISYSLAASGLTSPTVTLPPGATYGIVAVNSQGGQSPKTLVTVPAVAAPDLFVATTTSGADISSLTLNVGQTGMINLIQEFANPAPTFSVVTQPPSGGVSVDPTTGHVTYTPTLADLGTQAVTFAASNMAGTSDYTFYFFVQALQPTVTVSGGPVTYDGNPHGVTATAVGTDGSTVNGSFSFTYNGDPNPPTNAGTYAVVATFTSNDQTYASTNTNYTLTINPAAPTVTVNVGPFAYDGTAHGATATAVGVDGSTSVDGTFAFTYNGDPNPPTNPGLYTVVATFTSNDPNYTSPTLSADLIITSPGTLVPTLSLVDGSTTYDGNPHADSATADGTDGLTPVNGSYIITYNGSTTAPTAVGSYAVVVTFISSDLNYTGTSITSTLTISPATPTLSFGYNTFSYTGQGATADVTALGADGVTPVNGTYSVTYDGSSALPVNAGTYTVDVTFTSNDPNYNSTSGSSTLTILPATPSVGLGNGGQWQFTYNGLPQSVVGSAVGVDGVTPVLGTFSYVYTDIYGTGAQLPGAPTNAGYYGLTETFTSQDPNYTDGSFSWYLEIYSAQPTMVISGGPFTYNGSGQSATVSVVGIDGVTQVAGSASVTYNGSQNVPRTAGTYSVSAVFSPSDPNYYSVSGTGTLVINKATPAFSNLGAPTINVGTSTATLSGHIAAGSAAPGGDDVAVTLNGVTVPATVSSSGSFSATFNTLGLAPGTYTVTYSYLGDATEFNAAAAAGSSTLTVRSVPGILTSPSSQTVVSGNTVTFTASASGFPTPTVQWQVSRNGGQTFSNISGATSTSYTPGTVTSGQNGYEYRAVFTNSAGSATTSAALLTVQFAPSVTSGPSSATVTAGQTATFTAAASGNPLPSVQWQLSTDAGTTWTNIAGATSSTLTLTGLTGGQNGSRYRAVFSNSVGSATTSSATLTVHYAPVVGTNPTSQTVSAGQNATFTASATGNSPPTVQWQLSTDGGTTWTNISGANSTTLTLNHVAAGQTGYQYRAVFTNSLGSTTTTAATLTVH
jgi:N-acetylneuraminic acid mutarotase